MSWNFLKFNEVTYFFKLNTYNEKISFYVSDLKELWHEECNVNEILSRAKELNKRIEYDNETILSTINTTPAHWDLQKTDNNEKESLKEEITLHLKYYITGKPFHFKWKLKSCPSSEFRQLILNPIFISMRNFSKQNDELINIIKKKDIEIEQYKLEGAVLRRSKVATETFSETDFRSKYRTDTVDTFINYACENYEELQNDCGKETEQKTASSSNDNETSKKRPNLMTQRRNRRNVHGGRLIHNTGDEKFSYVDSDSGTPPTVDEIAEIEKSLKELQRRQKEDLQPRVSLESPKKKIPRKKFNL